MALQMTYAHGQWSFPHPVPLLLPHLPIKYQSRPPWARHCAQHWVFNTEQNSSSFPRPKRNILEANFCPIITSLSPPCLPRKCWLQGKPGGRITPPGLQQVTLCLCFAVEHAPPDTLPLLHLKPPRCLLPLTWPLNFEP